jgi:hypothetical protein
VPDLDIAGVVRTLNAHGVRYVVIGGVAATVHGLPLPATVDIDVTPSRRDEEPRAPRKGVRRLGAGLLMRRNDAPVGTPARPTRSTRRHVVTWRDVWCHPVMLIS